MQWAVVVGIVEGFLPFAKIAKHLRGGFSGPIVQQEHFGRDDADAVVG